MGPELTDRLIGVKQVCSALGISRSTFYRLLATGKLPIQPVKHELKRDRLFRLSDVKAYLEGTAR